MLHVMNIFNNNMRIIEHQPISHYSAIERILLSQKARFHEKNMLNDREKILINKTFTSKNYHI